MFAYALTIFLGAFLLFQVQPLIGKYILPWFGGGPGVWTTCMLFFQMLLLGGYAYAHFLSQKLKPRTQVIVHLVLLAVAVALLPITPGDSWKPDGQGNPVWQILLLLTVCLGLPYFVLSSTGPLMQQWFSRTNPGVSPYRLYALSNVGSLLALVSYPFYFETHFTRIAQARLWAGGLVVFVVVCGWCAWKLWQAKPKENPASTSHEPVSPPPATSILTRLLWLLLPACASVLLLATTNKLCQDVAVIPFLWVLPLALYLLSFVICFDSPRWYVRGPFALALIASLAALCWVMPKGVEASIQLQVGVYVGTLFLCCMICHGELYRLRPDPRQLTGFYLMIAAGGALGGVFVAAIAPMIFTDYYELSWGLVVCGALFIVVCAREIDLVGSKPRWWMTSLLTLMVWVLIDQSLAWMSKHASIDAAYYLVGLRVSLWGLLVLTVASWIALRARDMRFTDLKTWRWLACALTLAGVGGIHYSFVWLETAFPSTTAHSLVWLEKIFPTKTEHRFLSLHIGLGCLWLGTLSYWLVRKKFRTFQHWQLLTCVWLSLGVLALGGVLWFQANGNDDRSVISRSRNFYGTLKVCEYKKEDPDNHYLLLQHGRITHGIQLTDPASALMPTSYYAKGSGVELAVRQLPKTARHIGVVGLGTGSMAVFGRAGDQVQIYEINRDVERLATSRFTYLSNCPAHVKVTMGDARLSMERQPPQGFDLLALDAFSSDAIPVHLLTQEAFTLYGRHMKTNGVIAVHVSNRYLDLEPVVANLARAANYKMAIISYEEPDELDEDYVWWVYSSTWILLTRSEEIINSAEIAGAASPGKTNAVKIPLWTDDFASVFQILH